MNTNKPNSIDEYIAGFPEDIQKILRQIRETVRKAAPDAKEAIKYDMPTFTRNGNLVHFAAFKHHIGFYPAPTHDEAYQSVLSGYKTGRGSVQFPLDKPMPLDLITLLVEIRVKKDMEGKKTK